MTADTAKILEHIQDIFNCMALYFLFLSFTLVAVPWKLDKILKLIRKDD